jgi:hypothetical protein
MIKGLRKVAGAPLEIGKDPISIFAPYELQTRLKESIELHCFSVAQHYPEIERGKQRSLPFVVDRRSVAVARTRPATLVIYSAPVLLEFERQSLDHPSSARAILKGKTNFGE